MNSIFNIIDENSSFSITTPSHGNSKSAKKAFDKLHKLLDLRYENDIELNVEQFRKKR